MKKLLVTIVWVMTFLCALSQGIVINEVAYTNEGPVTDWQGDSPDWFELFNGTGEPVNLSGYKITDDTSKIEFWKFPEYVLNHGDYLLVFASGKDTILGNEFHTSFKISNMRETLYLIQPDGMIGDQIDPVCVPSNNTRARLPDGSPHLAVITPSPGITNNNATLINVNFVPDSLTVNLSSGFFDNPVEISFHHLHNENEIRYSLDGEFPEEDAELYSGPIQLNDLTKSQIRFADIPETIEEPGDLIFKGNIVRAIVFSNGCPASNEISNTYFINKDLRYPVPIVSLITEADNLFDDETGIYVHGKYRNFDQHGIAWERPVHVEIFDPEGKQITDQDAGMRIHGRGSRRSPQKSLRLYAEEEYGKKYFEYPYFSQKPWLSKFRVLLLRTTGGTLGPLFKEELCNSLVRNMNMDYPAGETAILFINGEYWGIYNLMERQNSYFIENNYGVINAKVDIVAYDRDVIAEEGTLDDYYNLITYLQSADPASPEFYGEMEKRMDLVNLMDYYCAQLYFANTDWPYSNVELWKLKNDTSKWRHFFFDSDASMVWLNDDHLSEYNNDIDDFQRYPEFCIIILKKLLNNEKFREQFVQRLSWHLNYTFNTDRVLEAIDAFENKYSQLVQEHVYRWHSPVNYSKWEENIDWLRTFAVQRPLFLGSQVTKNFGEFVKILPNPSNGNFRLEFVVPPDPVTVKILSVNGVLLEQWSFTALESSVIPISTSLPPGVYILQTESGTIRYNTKLVIQSLL